MNQVSEVHKRADKWEHSGCCVVQTQPGTFQLGNSRQSSCPQPTAHPAQGWHTQTASACPAGHQAAGSQMCNHLLCPAYEEASPAESQALCPRLNKMDLGCKVLGWDKPELLGAASSEQPHPAVPVLGQVSWLPRMAPAVAAAPAPSDVSAAIGRGKSWGRTPKRPALGKTELKWNCGSKVQIKLSWANDQLFLVVLWIFMNSKQQAKQAMNILDMVLTSPTQFSILVYF